MILPDNTNKKLKSWIGWDTWYKNNTSDMNMFFDFVNEYSKEVGFSIIEEDSLIETIADIAKIPMNEREIEEGQNYLYSVIKEKISLMHDILDFLKATKR